MPNSLKDKHFILAGPTQRGGVASFNRRLYNALSEEGFQVSFLSLKGGQNSISLSKLIFSKKSDLVFISSLYTCYLLLFSFYKKVFILHGFRPFNQGVIKAMFSYYSMYFGGKRAEYVIANSELTSSFYKRFMNIDSTVFPLIFDSEKLKKENGQESIIKDIDLLFVGRLESQKNVDVILKALAEFNLHSSHPINFHIVGDGAELNKLKKLTNDLGLQNYVHFAGYLPSDHVEKYYQRAKCFVSLGLLEPYGLVFEEAINHDLPMIIHRYSGILEFYKTPKFFPVALNKIDILSALRAVFIDSSYANSANDLAYDSQKIYFHNNLLELLK